jgi:bifunctional DNA-binding transcriptional regulator/antitoxin component of YhaV-PrlF toxin-antitoxin module
MATTRISKKYLTAVPAEVRRIFQLEAGDELEWLPLKSEIIVKPIKKKGGKDPILEIIGMVDAEPTDVTRDHDKILYGEK